jgi:GNAT superfamily N-acetyltransferase
MLSFSQFILESKEVHFEHPETGSKAKVVHEKDGGLLFTNLETPAHGRGKGGAHHVIKQATDYADKHKKHMRLNAIAHDDHVDPKGLINLYKKHGFEHEDGKPKFMMKRKPN